MSMLEPEALKKQCCIDRKSKCIGSDCMGWQWNDGQQNDYGKERPSGDDWQRVGNFWTRTPREGKPWRPGHCGVCR